MARLVLLDGGRGRFGRVRALAPVAALAIVAGAVAAGVAGPAAGALSTGGFISTVAGGAGGPGPATSISQSPQDLEVVGSNMYVTDDGGVVRKIDLGSGTESTVLGVGSGGILDTCPNSSNPNVALYAPRTLALRPDGSGFVSKFNLGVAPVCALTAQGGIALAGGVGGANPGDGGPFLSALLPSVKGMTFASNGDLLLTSNDRLRRVSASNMISTFAGGANPGYTGDGGPSASAQLRSPTGVAVDGAGNVFIADTGNHAIRKINAGGTISTVAGTGIAGNSGDGGQGTLAKLNGPTALAVDSTGNVYFADQSGSVIRRLSSTGGISRVAGNVGLAGTGDGGPATEAGLKADAIAIDANNNVYVGGDKVIRKFAVGSTISRFGGNGQGWESGNGEPATGAQLDSPNGVAVAPNGDMYVAVRRDNSSSVVRKVTANGTISHFAGGGATTGTAADGGPATSAALGFNDLGLAIAQDGSLLIADAYSHLVRRVSTTGTIFTFAGTGTEGSAGDNGPAAAATLSGPTHVSVRNGTTFILDKGNNKIRKVVGGTISTMASTTMFAQGIAADSAGTVYVGSSYPGSPTQRITAAGVASDFTVESGCVRAIAVEATGTVLGAGDCGRSLYRYSADGATRTRLAGGGFGFGYTGDGGPSTQALLGDVAGIATDGGANIYMADGPFQRVRRINAPTVPDAPSAPSASPGNGQVTAFALNPVDGGSPILSYTFSASPGGASCTSPNPSCTITGLTNGTAYAITVVATNGKGTGPASPSSAAVTPRTVPSAPQAPSALAGNAQAQVQWSPPLSNGGAPIAGYLVTASPGGATCTWTNGPLACTVPGLSNGTQYTFSVAAGNAAGFGPPSASTSPVTPSAVSPPGPPTGVVAVPSNAAAVVSWAAPASTGGAPVTAYTVTSSPEGKSCAWSSGPLSCTVPGLTNGTSYMFSVTATNSAGTGPASSASSGVMPVSGSYYHPLSPTRILDSRGPNGGWNARLAAGTPKALTVTGGSSNVPANVDAVVVNVTATGSSSGSFLTVYPAGGSVPGTSSLNFAAGETIPNLVTVKVGTNGQVAFATAVGTVDVIVDIVGYFDAVPADRYTAVAPARILDSRGPNGGWNAKLLAGTPKNLQIRNAGGVPASADAVIVNVTATGGSANSFLTVYPSGGAVPTASNVNFAAGQTIPNLVVVKIGTNGQVAFANAVGGVDVIADVVGYFEATSGDVFHALSPVRVLDSRGPIGGWNAKLSAGVPRDLTITGQGGVPENATAVFGNTTVTGGSANSFVTVYPAGQSVPIASNVNFAAGQTIPNLVAVKIGSNGRITFSNAAGAVDVIFDTTGYFTPN